MRRTVALLSLVLALALVPSTAATTKILVARVGLHDSYVISLKTPAGRVVRTIPAGTYTIVVHDYSRLHNFALGSQTANRRLFTGGVRWTGTKSYKVTLTPGHYAYACSAHPYTMNGTFTVVGG